MPAATKKYLQGYSEPESQCLDTFPARYQHCIVLPLYKESPKALARFCQSASLEGATLIIAVVNRPDEDENTLWAQEIFNHASELSLIHTPCWQAPEHPLTLWPLDNNSGLLIIDRCIQGAPIPKKQGVGLARKIGADIACQLIFQKAVNSQWIHNSDADAHLPTDYFQSTAILNQQNDAAACYAFEHIFTNTTISTLPTKLYEFSLHYYVEGLRWAQSPYAYHTIGSIIVINSHHYAQVRGFPKRAGAEDFYLLNKLAKLGHIQALSTAPILIEARESDRVPFGTGPAVKKLAEIDDAKNIQLYHPETFQQLRLFHLLLQRLANEENLGSALDTLSIHVEKLSNDEHSITAIQTIAQNIGLLKALSHAFKQGKTAGKRAEQFTVWFDGFMTLKFIHLSRDLGAGTVSFYDLQALIKQELNTPNSFGQHIAETTRLNTL